VADLPTTAPTVTDHRTPPKGVLPRGLQTWLMVGLALVILGIIVLTGHPTPPSRASAPTPPPPLTTSTDRLRDYQDRLRAIDERARQQAPPAVPTPSEAPPERRENPHPTPDPLDQERRRRTYDSLFASNVVVSRRLDDRLLVPDRDRVGRALRPGEGAPVRPSLDDVAAAVVRASTRPPTAESTLPAAATPVTPSATARPTPSTMTPPGRMYRLTAGTVIDTVLTNRLDGAVAAPVNCLVTNPVYGRDGHEVVIPAGSRVLGETKPVQAFGETRLAVAFTRLVLPDGRAVPLDHFVGLNAIGDTGLRDQVDQHYRSTFGAAAAIGLIAGFAQLAGATVVGGSAGDRTLVITSAATESTAQASSQTLNRFLNRLPTITIREGHRVKVYLTNDLDVPAPTRQP